jgi:hypothetical protein
MKTLDEIKSAVTHLPNREFSRFRKWFDEYETRQWDKQIEKDIKNGRLAKIGRKALKDFQSGRCSQL